MRTITSFPSNTDWFACTWPGRKSSNPKAILQHGSGLVPDIVALNVTIGSHLLLAATKQRTKRTSVGNDSQGRVARAIVLSQSLITVVRSNVEVLTLVEHFRLVRRVVSADLVTLIGGLTSRSDVAEQLYSSL